MLDVSDVILLCQHIKLGCRQWHTVPINTRLCMHCAFVRTFPFCLCFLLTYLLLRQLSFCVASMCVQYIMCVHRDVVAQLIEHRPRNPMDFMTRGSNPVRSIRNTGESFSESKCCADSLSVCPTPRVYTHA